MSEHQNKQDLINLIWSLSEKLYICAMQLTKLSERRTVMACWKCGAAPRNKATIKEEIERVATECEDMALNIRAAGDSATAVEYESTARALRSVALPEFKVPPEHGGDHG